MGSRDGDMSKVTHYDRRATLRADGGATAKYQPYVELPATEHYYSLFRRRMNSAQDPTRATADSCSSRSSAKHSLVSRNLMKTRKGPAAMTDVACGNRYPSELAGMARLHVKFAQ